ncbi:MAG: phosphodiester glycosidase family protein [Bacteroidota bacterium]
MTRPHAFLFVLVALMGLGACAPVPDPDQPLRLTWTPVDSLQARLPDGITIYNGHSLQPPVRAWYARIDEADPDIETRVVVSDEPDGRESTSRFARDLGACVVANGGFFIMEANPTRHVGLLQIDGAVLAGATPSVRRDTLRYETARGAIGFTEDGQVDITWATTRRDTVYSWGAPPTHTPGTPSAPLDYTEATPWPVRDALSGGPVLLRDGRLHVTADAEVFFGTSIPDIHPRTAAGTTADGALILMVVDGRQPASRGVSLDELAQLMRAAGAVEAVNLDGGGSSTLVVDGLLINRPTGGTVEREVMSALATTCVR